MAIISKTSVNKNEVSAFTLNKSELQLVESVVEDTYFADPTNWKRVRVCYTSSDGNQREVVVFDATQAVPTGEFLVSEKARDEFLVRKIVIEDFDGGWLDIPRTSLNASEFDILISILLSAPFSSTLKSANVNLLDDNYTAQAVNSTPVQTYQSLTLKGSATYGTAKLYVEFRVNGKGTGPNTAIPRVGFNVFETNITPNSFSDALGKGNSGLSLKVTATGFIELRNPVNQGASIQSSTITISVNDKVGLALDTQAGTISVYINGALNQTVDYGTNSVLDTYNFTGQDIYASAVVNLEGNVTIIATPDFIPSGFDLMV
jgi:hypothetical protein